MHMCYERPGLVAPLNGGTGYEKWDRERDRGGGSGGGGGGGGAAAWAGRDRERDRERERQARAHQMSHANAAENDASSLFPAPIRVNNRDRVSQQIQIKLGDYHLAQTLLDDPSKSIGICAEPPSPAPCPPRRESEFKKPSHAPQNGRVHHRPYNYNKNDGSNSTAPSQHRPPPIRISNGYPAQHTIDSSQPPIESILKEMQALPNPISSIAATPRKETDNKFIFNPYTNKVQENPQLASTELKAPPPKPGLDNRISNSRSSVSPDVVHKDLGLSESDEETPAPSTTHPDPAHPDPAQLDPAQLDSAHFQTEPILSPIGSASPSTSESSPSDSESESSSAESAPPPAEAPPAQRPSWSLANFAPARPAGFDAANDLRHALADVKGKPIFSNFVREFVNADCTDPNQKWTNLALLKCSLRQSLLCFEYNLRYIVLEEDRAVMLAEFFRLKDILWQAIGGLHGSLMSAPFPSPISELSDSEVSSPSPKRRRRSVVNNQSSDDEAERKTNAKSPRSGGAKRGRPAKPRPEENPAKRRRGRPRKPPPAPPSPPAPRVPSPPPPAPPLTASDTKTHIFRKVFTPKKVDECGGKGGKGGKGKGGKGKGQVTIIEATAPEGVAHERHRDEIVARVSPPQEPETVTRKREAERVANERIQERVSIERSDSRPPDRPGHDRLDRPSHDRSSDRFDRSDRSDKSDRSEKQSDKSLERLSGEKLDKSHERLSETKSHDRLSSEKHERLSNERLSTEKISHDRLSGEKMSHDRLSGEKMSRDRLSGDKMSHDRLSVDQTSHDRLSGDKLSHERLSCDKMSDKMDRISMERYIRAEADVGSGLKSGRGSERLEEASSIASSRRRSRALVHIPLSRLRAATVRALQLAARRPKPKSQPPEVAPTNHERAASISISEQTPIYYSYFERLPADALSDEERDHKYYLGEAKRLRTTAESEQEPLARVMLYLESVLCFVLTGRVLELERDTKRAFTIYRETIEYIKSIHSMPQRFRASPHSTFSKLDILSLRVQALLYLRMFKMYNREVKEYNKIVQEYQQKPACPESVSPLSPTPSPAGSVTSVGSAASAASVASTSSGYCSLAHAVPAPAHNALLQLTKYYTFLYVAHELWEQADCLCRLRCNQDLFIAVDRKCGPLTLSSTFQHLVQYVRHAISLLKSPPRE